MDIRAWTIEIARGEASDRLRRGSFRHRDRVREARMLTVTDERRTEAGLSFALTDPRTGRTSRGAWETVPGPAGCVLRRLRLDLSPFGTNRARLTWPIAAEEHFFGGGETFSVLDLRGRRLRVWTAEHQNARIIAEKLVREKLFGVRPERKRPFERYESYFAQPTLVSSGGYFLHAAGTAYMEFDLRGPDRAAVAIRSGDEVCVFVGEGERFEDLSAGVASLVGTQPPMPERLLEGVILASQRGVESVERKLALAEAHGLPIVGVWCQDWCGCRETSFGYQVMWNWQWDRGLYPDLPEHIRAWRGRGVGFYGYINPFLAVEGPLYAEASRKGYCVRDSAGKDAMVTITTFPAAMVDLTNPTAREWMKSVIRTELIELGMAGWMADFGEYLPTDAVLFSGEDPSLLHNAWPVLWARLNREAIAEAGKEGEVFFFVRAGHTGTIAEAPMIWNGDQHADWSRDQGIGSVIPASLSLGMSGAGVCHSDVGGYTSVSHIRRTAELFMRWAELSCFSPLMRLHEGNRPGVNVQFDGEERMLEHLAEMGRLHARLGPYLREQLGAYRERGLPVTRPLFYHYADPALCAVDDEYLLGRDILAAPVLLPEARERRVVLPEDTWVHLFTGEEYGGGAFTVPAPLGRPPVFIRKSSPWREKLLPLE